MSNVSNVFGVRAREVGAKLTTSPLAIEAQGRIGLSQAELFAYVTDASRLPEWLPMCKKALPDDSKAETPGGVGSVRKIWAGAPNPTEETVVLLDAPNVYAYKARDRDLFGMYTNHLSVITVEPHPLGGSVITWLSYGVPSSWMIVHYVGLRVFSRVLRGGVKNLERRFPIS